MTDINDEIYLPKFMEMILSSLEESYLFTEEEVCLLNEIINMDLNGQKLLCRLIQRKVRWLEILSLKYDFVDGINHLQSFLDFEEKSIRINQRTEKLIEKVDVVFFRSWAYKVYSLKTRILIAINRLKFVPCLIQKTKVWESREVLEEYIEALRWEHNEEYEKAMDKWPVSLKPSLFPRFQPGYIYTKMIQNYAEKLKKQKNYKRAESIYFDLLSQKIFRPHKRLKWFNELSLIYSKQKNLTKTYETCLDALKEFDDAEIEARAINTRKKLRGHISEPSRFAKRLEFKQVCIYSLYSGRVEDFALGYYSDYEGIHTETRIFTTIFTAMCFKEIFLNFQSEVQTWPHVLNIQNFDFDFLVLLEEFEQYRGCIIRGVDWSIQTQHLKEICKCLEPHLKDLCILFAKKYELYKSGGPDLCLWKNGKLKFSEVKTTDELSSRQIMWLETLNGWGLEVEVLRVLAP